VEYKVISTDNHVVEAPNAFTDHLPDEFKERAPRIMRGEDSGDGWSFDGKPPKITFASHSSPWTMGWTSVFERFSDLKFVDAEVNVGWLPFWIQMMEQEYERQRHWAHPPLQTNPREFVGKNLFVTVLDDHVGFAELTEGMDDARKHDILAGNAVRVLNLDSGHGSAALRNP
jgi:hypothetical protein